MPDACSLMRLGFRRCCITAAVLLIGGSSTSYASDDPEDQRKAAEPTHGQQQPESPPLAVRIDGPVLTVREKEIETDWSAVHCDAAKNHDEADLCEQRKMVKAAQRTVDLNIVQIGVGIVGFALVGLTLVYTRRATEAAVAAAATAEKAMFEIEAPYLFPIIERDSLLSDLAVPYPNSQHKPVSPAFSLTIKNYGRGPAIFDEVAVSASHWRRIPDDPAADVRVDSGMPTMIEAGQKIASSFEVRLDSPLGRADVASIVEQASHIYLYGAIIYSGVQNAGYVQRFCLMYHYPTKRFVPAGAEYNNRTRQPARSQPAARRWFAFTK